MACQMGGFERHFLWSSCDQCGTNMEIEYATGGGIGDGGRLTGKGEAEQVRDEWNKHHRQCSTARGIKAPRFTHDRDDLITYV